VLAVFFPAAWLATAALHGATPSQARAWTLAALLLNPANIIIDHGHFQYNCISLGFALAAAAAISRGWHILGSVLFCGALNHKQMSLYYAPAFFAHLLGRCFQARSFVGKVRHVGADAEDRRRQLREHAFRHVW
jgi:alpha-1,3-glucosyltransferase